MSATDFTEIDFAEIRRWLERSDRRELCKDFHIKSAQLSRILSGKRRNMKVLERAMQIAAERKARVTSHMNRLKQIAV